MVTNTGNELGYWVYTDYSDRIADPFKMTSEIANCILDRVVGCLVILREEELLYPKKIILTASSWRKVVECGKDEFSDMDFSRALCLDLSNANIKEQLKTLLYREHSSDGFVYAYNYEIEGIGKVYTSEDELVLCDDVIRFESNEANFKGIVISTHVDCWLRYELETVRPQPEIHRLNAPRLERALERIGEHLGIDAREDDRAGSDAAYLDGYKFENRGESDGSPDPVDPATGKYK